MDLGLAGKRALVVGASYGIGYATAEGLLREGAEVLICSRQAENLSKAAKGLSEETGREVKWLDVDVTTPAGADGLAAWVARSYPALDILVCAVGGSYRAAFEELRDEDWLASYHLNVLSAVRVVRAHLPLLKRAGRARVVLLGAASAKQPTEQQIVSNVHKSALLGLTKTLALEYAAHGILVNSVLPGRTLTPLWLNRAERQGKERGVDPQTILAEVAATIPLGRFARPQEIAAMVVFLCSGQASYVTGQSINVDGGLARGIV